MIPLTVGIRVLHLRGCSAALRALGEAVPDSVCVPLGERAAQVIDRLETNALQMIGDELCAAPEGGGEVDDDDDNDGGTGRRIIAV